jgi:SAM-dependent methyltransferase
MEAAHYAKHENDPADPAYRRFLARAIEPLLAVVPRGASGLDYGCGPGPTASLMLRAAGVHCVDYDPFFFPNPGALCGRERYDCIVCTETCEHFHQPLRDFALLDRLLKPGGWLALMTEPRDPEASFASWWYPGDPTHVSFFAPSTIDWLAARFAWESQRPSRTVWLLRKGRQG